VTIHPGAQVLIMTNRDPAHAMFENPALPERRNVIFSRSTTSTIGSVWEESLIFLPPEVRLICL
jgi:hypothetical protein